MSEKQPRSTYLEATPLTRLNILVHPLFLTKQPDDTYHLATDFAYKNAVKRFVPQNESEFCLVMPLIRRNETPLENLDRTRLFENKTWIDLYKKLKSHSSLPENVRITNNVMETGIQQLIDRLKKFGKTFNETTVLTLGGEYTDACVLSVAKNMLGISYVEKLRIDKKVSVTSDGKVDTMVNVNTGPWLDQWQDYDFIYLSKVSLLSLYRNSLIC